MVEHACRGRMFELGLQRVNIENSVGVRGCLGWELQSFCISRLSMQRPEVPRRTGDLLFPLDLFSNTIEGFPILPRYSSLAWSMLCRLGASMAAFRACYGYVLKSVEHVFRQESSMIVSATFRDSRA